MSDPGRKADVIRRAVRSDDPDGQEAAVQELIQIYLRTGELDRFIRGQRPHKNADVDALVDDTLLEMRASIGSFAPPAEDEALVPAFEAWVRNFARWNVVDDARHWRTKTKGGDRHEVTDGDVNLELHSEQDVLDFFAADEASASRVVADDKIVRKVLAVCDFLRQIAPDREADYFAPFELYVQKGLTRNEIADELRMSPGAVANRLRESMKLLQGEWSRLSAFVSAQAPQETDLD